MGALVFAAAFAVYAWTASPAVGWLDSPEFVAAATSLGVAHSPGHPAAALLGKLASFLPFGDLPFRINLMSAFAAAAAALVVYRAAMALVTRVAPGFSPRCQRIISAGAGLVYAWSWAAWAQAVRAEVYALQSLLCAVVVLGILRLDDPKQTHPRWLLLAALASGLALSNHHFIALAVVLPAAVTALARKARARPITLSACACLGILGLAVFLYLPIRSSQSPEVNWGAPHTAERFVWTVSAKAFQKSATRPPAPQDGGTAAVGAAIIEAVTLPLFGLSLLALILGLRKPGWRRSAGFLGAIVVLSVLGRAAVGFESETTDHHGYLLPAIAAVVILAAAGVAALTQLAVKLQPMLRRGGPLIAATAVLLVAPVQLVANGSRASLKQAYASDAMARWELDAVPPRGVVLVSYFQTSFRLWALRAVEHSRPDVAILDRSFLTYPGAAEQARARYPELATLIDAPLRADRPTPTFALTELAGQRPVVAQLHINLDDALSPQLLPVGAFAWVLPSPPTDATRERAEQFDEAARAALEAQVIDGAQPAERTEARLAALWVDVMRLRFYCQMARKDAAARSLASAARFAAGDPMLKQTARDCGLEPPQ